MATRKLKVFHAKLGFYDSVVAAPSQAAALKAWGLHQNLFASGDATIVTDQAAIRAALAHPETPLSRAIGSSDPFELEPTRLPEIPDAPKKPASRPAPKLRSPKSDRAPADRAKLDVAETALRNLDEARKHEEAELRSASEALEARRAAAQQAYVDARKAATARVAEARAAYRKAGGED